MFRKGETVKVYDLEAGDYRILTIVSVNYKDRLFKLNDGYVYGINSLKPFKIPKKT